MVTGANIYSMNLDGSGKRLVLNLGSDTYDVIYELNARLFSDMPEYHFVAMGSKWEYDGWPFGFVMGIEVYDDTGAVIFLDYFSKVVDGGLVGNPVNSEMMDTMGLHVVDVNFDGYKDMILLNSFTGPHCNTQYYCWLWDSETSLFVKSESFAEISNPALDPLNKCIYSSWSVESGYWGSSIYKYINGEFVATNDINADRNVLLETELLNGEMVIVHEVHYTEGKGKETVEAKMEYYKNNEVWQLDYPHWYWSGGHHADRWLGG